MPFSVEFQQATVDKDNLTHEVAKLRLELSRKEQELVANDKTLTETREENEELTAKVESLHDLKSDDSDSDNSDTAAGMTAALNEALQPKIKTVGKLMHLASHIIDSD